MRLVLLGAALTFAAFAAFSDVTYLRDGGYAGDLPEHRRIDVRAATDCADVIDRADRTFGDHNGFACERVPLVRHVANVVRDAFERHDIVDVALNALRTDAVAGNAQATQPTR
ncbi:hypothetical protein ACFQ4O_13385 [Methylopila musalis]|uniref:UrcA family protein n=1 Tax=Methylopila musalis TaxID=1134781 RepID=A0ABW3ZAF7_9HYPH